jgi:hypothetical protein
MNLTTIFILFLYTFATVSGNRFNSRFRNSLLRIYIASDKKDIINEYKNKLVNKILTKYNNINLFYNSLTQEEKELIDAIITLCY